jgi:hypothetical protein
VTVTRPAAPNISNDCSASICSVKHPRKKCLTLKVECTTVLQHTVTSQLVLVFIKMDYFSTNPENNYPHYYVGEKRQNFAWTHTHTNIGTWNRYYVRVPNTIFSIHYKESNQHFTETKQQELQPTVPLSFLPFGKPYRGSYDGSFMGCGVPSGSEYKAQPFPIIEHYYETFSLKTWHLPTHHTQPVPSTARLTPIKPELRLPSDHQNKSTNTTYVTLPPCFYTG